MITYVEGNSLHPERGGASTFARYAFNELVSFMAGWAIVLDYLIVMAIAALAVPHYLSAFWGNAGDAGVETVIIALVLAARGGLQRARHLTRAAALRAADHAAERAPGGGDHRRRAVHHHGLLADHRLDRPRRLAARGRPDLRRDAGRRRGHRDRGGVGPGRRGQGGPARAAALRGAQRGRRVPDARRGLGGRADGGARSPTAPPRWAAASSRCRCWAWSRLPARLGRRRAALRGGGDGRAGAGPGGQRPDARASAGWPTRWPPTARCRA